MKSLCVGNEADDLATLEEFVSSGQLTGTQAWAAFSDPHTTKVFEKKKVPPITITFTPLQVATYKKLRQTVQETLYARCRGSCAYCRRPVGHYGWAWHIEHVYPKSKYKALTFKLSNLTVGCVHCNQWKGSRVDRSLARGGVLPIIDPSAIGFRYADHLQYLQMSTESLHFAKYKSLSPSGESTYDLLSFSELERAYAIDGLNGTTAALHDRLTRAMGAGLSKEGGQEFTQLLADLRSAIYKQP